MSENDDEISIPPEYLEPQRLRAHLAAKSDVLIIDVRSPEEYAANHIEGAVNIPAGDIRSRANEIASDCAIVTVCNLGGNRSTEAAKLLRSLGYERVMPLRGGMRGWSEFGS